MHFDKLTCVSSWFCISLVFSFAVYGLFLFVVARLFSDPDDDEDYWISLDKMRILIGEVSVLLR